MAITDDRPVVLHQGVYKKTATTAEAVFLITGMIVGAGVLGLPYAISTVGLPIGLVFLVALGGLTLILHLMLGEIALRTKTHLQLPGFAGKYLGRAAKSFVSATIIIRSYGALLAYVIGAGAVLAAMLGGSSLGWSVIFWSVGSAFIWSGLRSISKVEKIISFSVLAIIAAISLFILPEATASNLHATNFSNFFFPIGVILFALSGTPAVAEAHALLPGSERRFRKALIIGTLVPTVLYLLFSVAVVGVFGSDTSEVATLALASRFGGGLAFFANLFAVLAMSTAFMTLGTALKESFIWDHKIPRLAAIFLVVSVPLSLFLLGLRQFVLILEVVGGIFIAAENIMMVLVYFKARAEGDTVPKYFRFTHAVFFGSIVLAFFAVVVGVNIYQIARNFIY